MAVQALSVGSFGAQVAELQRQLAQLGYAIPAAEVDRKFFGPATRRAVMQLQQARGLAATGVADSATLAAMPAGPVAVAPASASPASAAAPANQALTAGAFGSGVAQLQSALSAAGFDISPGESSRAFFGASTGIAVRLLQQRVGLPVTGTVDAKTAAALQARVPPPAPKAVPKVSPPGPKSGPTQVHAAPNQPSAPPRKSAAPKPKASAGKTAPSALGEPAGNFIDLVGVTPEATVLTNLTEAPAAAQNAIAETFGTTIQAKLSSLLANAPTLATLAAKIALTPDQIVHAQNLTVSALLKQQIEPAVAHDPALKQTVDSEIAKVASGGTVGALLGLTQPLQSHPLFQSAVQKAGIAALVATSPAVAENKQLQADFVSAYTSFKGPLNSFLTALPGLSPGLLPSEVSDLNLTMRLASVTGNNAALMSAVRAAYPIESMADLAKVTTEDWTQILDTPVNGSLMAIPSTTPGATRDEQVSAYVSTIIGGLQSTNPTPSIAQAIVNQPDINAAIVKTVLSAFPDLNPSRPLPASVDWGSLEDGKVLATMNALRMEIHAFPTSNYRTWFSDDSRFRNPVREAVAGLLLAQANTDIRTANLADFVNSDTEAEAVFQIGSLQRLARMIPDYATIYGLQGNGFHSAYSIAQVPQGVFLNQVSAFVGTRAAAQVIYSQAMNVYAAVANLRLQVLDGLYGAVPQSFGEVAAGTQQVLSDGFPNWTTLFGDPSTCQCGECSSLLGAAAYFVDLMHFLAKSGPNPQGETPLEVLQSRRPDLWYLKLDCDNTNTELPYLDLVNEILESYVAFGQLDWRTTKNTPSDATTGELCASPEYTNSAVYDVLKAAIAPLCLPFDLPLEVARVYLNFLGSPRDETMRTFQHDNSPTDLAIACDYLGISSSTARAGLATLPPEVTSFLKIPIRMDMPGGRLMFWGAMTAAQQTQLIHLSTQIDYRNAINALFAMGSLIGTGSYSAPLATCPVSLDVNPIPISYVPPRRIGIFKGSLTFTGTMNWAQTEILLGVSVDPAYQAAINELSNVSSQAGNGTYEVQLTSLPGIDLSSLQMPISYVDANLRFQGTMSLGQQTILLGLSPDPSYQSVVNELYLISARAERGSYSVVYTHAGTGAELSKNPIPITYDASTSMLVFEGAMTAAQRVILLGLSTDQNYQDAVQNLFLMGSQASDSPFVVPLSSLPSGKVRKSVFIPISSGVLALPGDIAPMVCYDANLEQLCMTGPNTQEQLGTLSLLSPDSDYSSAVQNLTAQITASPDGIFSVSLSSVSPRVLSLVSGFLDTHLSYDLDSQTLTFEPEFASLQMSSATRDQLLSLSQDLAYAAAIESLYANSTLVGGGGSVSTLASLPPGVVMPTTLAKIVTYDSRSTTLTCNGFLPFDAQLTLFAATNNDPQFANALRQLTSQCEGKPFSELDLILGAVPRTLAELYGLTGIVVANLDAIAWLQSVQSGFLDATGLEYNDLIALLETRYLNPNQWISLSVPAGADPCNLEATTLSYTGDYLVPLAFFENALRFVRLWKKIGWKIHELDLAMRVLGAADITANLILELADVKRLQTELGMTVEQTLAFWADIDTVGRKSLYMRLFQNRAVINPVDTAFALSYGAGQNVASPVLSYTFPASGDQVSYNVSSGSLTFTPNSQFWSNPLTASPQEASYENAQLAALSQDPKWQTTISGGVQTSSTLSYAPPSWPFPLPDSAINTIQYANGQILFAGLMTDAEYATLKTLSADPAYQLAIDNLYRMQWLNSVELASASQTITGHLNTILAALRIAPNDVNALLAGPMAIPDQLNLKNLSTLYRNAVLAQALNLSVEDVLTLRWLSGIDPFLSPDKTRRFVDLANEIQRSSFSIDQLNYIYANVGDPANGIGPLADNLVQQVAALQSGLQQIVAANAPVPDPNGTVLKQKLSSILDSKSVTAVMGLIGGTQRYTTPFAGPLPPSLSTYLGLPLTYNAQTGLLQFTSNMTAVQNTALNTVAQILPAGNPFSVAVASFFSMASIATAATQPPFYLAPLAALNLSSNLLPGQNLENPIPISYAPGTGTTPGQLTFTGVMTGAQLSVLQNIFTDATDPAFAPYQAALLTLYTASSQSSGSPITTALAALPGGATAFPSSPIPITFTPGVGSSLGFPGSMTTAQQAVLLSLSTDPSYAVAVNNLYAMGVPAGSAPPVYAARLSSSAPAPLPTVAPGIILPGDLPGLISTWPSSASTQLQFLGPMTDLQEQFLLQFAPTGDVTFTPAILDLYRQPRAFLAGEVTAPLTGFLSYSDVVAQLIENTNSLTTQAQYEFVLGAVLGYLQQASSYSLIEKTLAQSLGLDLNTVSLLLATLLPAQSSSATSGSGTFSVPLSGLPAMTPFPAVIPIAFASATLSFEGIMSSDEQQTLIGLPTNTADPLYNLYVSAINSLYLMSQSGAGMIADFLALGTGGFSATYSSTGGGPLSVSRVDSQIDFNWGSQTPDPSIVGPGFEVAWSAQFVAPYTDAYTYTLQVDPASTVTLSVGGQQLSLTTSQAAASPGTIALVSTPVSLDAGEICSLDLTYSTPGAVLPPSPPAAPVSPPANSPAIVLSCSSPSMPQNVLNPPGNAVVLDLLLLSRIALLLTTLHVKHEDLAWLQSNGGDFAGTDPNSGADPVSFDLATLPLQASSETFSVPLASALGISFPAGIPISFSQGVLLFEGMMSEAQRQTLVALAPTTTAYTAAIDNLYQISATYSPSWLDQWRRLNSLFGLKGALPRGNVGIFDLFETSAQGVNFATTLLPVIVSATGWTTDQVQYLSSVFGYQTSDFQNERALLKLRNCITLSNRLGVPCERLFAWATDLPDDSQAQDIKNTVKAKYDDSTWLTLGKQLSDKLRTKQRNALVAYVLSLPTITQRDITDSDGLYEYFLIDVEMSACMLTSRIVQAHAALQLFVRRCLMNLEPEVPPCCLDSSQWEWMQNYRVWQANREVFLFAENYIVPTLRDDMTPPFSDLLNSLLQNPVTDDNATQAYADYLNTLNDLSQLEISGIYWQQESPTEPAICSTPETDNSNSGTINTLHVFGRSQGSPHKYYYRHLTNPLVPDDLSTGTWTPWEVVSASISGDHLVPVVWNRRLFLFWPTFNESADPTSQGVTPGQTPGPSMKQLKVGLNWSEYKQGAWTSTQTTPDADALIPLGFSSYVAGTFSPNQFTFDTSLSTPPPLETAESVVIRVDFPGGVPFGWGDNLLPDPSFATFQSGGQGPNWSNSPGAWFQPLNIEGSGLGYNNDYAVIIAPDTFGPSLWPNVSSQQFAVLAGEMWQASVWGMSGEPSDTLLYYSTQNNNALVNEYNALNEDESTCTGQTGRVKLQFFDGSGNIVGPSPATTFLYTADTGAYTYGAVTAQAAVDGTVELQVLVSAGTCNPYEASFAVYGSATFSAASLQTNSVPIYEIGEFTFSGFPGQIDSTTDVTETPMPSIPPGTSFNFMVLTGGNGLAFDEGALLEPSTPSNYELMFPQDSLFRSSSYFNLPFFYSDPQRTYFVSSFSAWQGTAYETFHAHWHPFIGDFIQAFNWQGVPALLTLANQTLNHDNGVLSGLQLSTSSTTIPSLYPGVLVAQGHIFVIEPSPGAVGYVIDYVPAAPNAGTNYLYYNSTQGLYYTGYNQQQAGDAYIGSVVSDGSSITSTAGGSNFQTLYNPQELVAGLGIYPQYPLENVDFSPSGAYSIYNWEMFFHIPMLVATQLSANQQFEDASTWLEYIFNPTASSQAPTPQRYWNFFPFASDTEPGRIQDLLALLTNPNPDPEQSVQQESLLLQINASVVDPFNPFAIARLRPMGFMKKSVMAYLDNLIAWGDSLFSQNTRESINEATQIYVLAQQILGPRPPDIPERGTTQTLTYNDIQFELDSLSNPWVQLESEFPFSSVPGTASTSSSGLSANASFGSFYFCVPQNEQLLAYWDTVADRLYKIRHCMNITGQVEQLSLFSPPINPALLVAAEAAGIELSTLLSGSTASTPFYRFSYMLPKALELCAEVRSLGGALLSALEKNDAEALALLRAGQEVAVLQAVLQLKQIQLSEANANLQGLQDSLAVAQFRQQYYQGLVSGSYSPYELSQVQSLTLSENYKQSSQEVEQLGSELSLIPQFVLGLSGWMASPVNTISFGGQQLSTLASMMARALSSAAESYSFAATMAGLMGGWARRSQEWNFQLSSAGLEITQINDQISAAQFRVQIAQQDIQNQELQVSNSQAVQNFLTNKFTNQQLYSWMVTQISTVYFQCYKMALSLAQQSEAGYQLELGVVSSSFIQPSYWNSLKKGLLSGENLYQDLKTLELAYLSQNKREFEITRTISLLLLDPMALITLKEAGVCLVNLPEALFDMDYPGHYMRRIRSVSLTIPCVTGPYTSVNCTLTLVQSRIRANASTTSQTGYPEQPIGSDARFIYNFSATQSVATSTAQNDSGMFEVNFRDERYLPFEGSGAVSQWLISMPQDCNAFDFETITDVILNLKYTARDGGGGLSNAARGAARMPLPQAQPAPATPMTSYPNQTNLVRYFSLKHEFPTGWYQFLNPTDPSNGQVMSFALTPERFPFQYRGMQIQVTGVDLFLKFKDAFPENMTATGTTGTPLNAYCNGLALTYGLSVLASGVPPPLNCDPAFQSINYPEGLPHSAVGNLSVKAGAAQWQITIAAGQNIDSSLLITVPPNAASGTQTYQILNPALIYDLFVVCRYSASAKQS